MIATATRRKRRRPWAARPAAVGTSIVQTIALLLVRGNRDQTEAISANPNPIFGYDENGRLLNRPVYLKGDESYHYYEDEHGYTLIDDPDFTNSTTYATRKVYAELDHKSGNLVSTGITFGTSQDATINGGLFAGLEKHIKPHDNVQKRACGQYCKENISQHVRGGSKRRGLNRRNLREHTNRRKLMSSTNTLRNLVVLIRFADHASRVLPSVSDFDVLLNGPGGEGTVAPTGSVNDVFLSNSYGQFSLNSTIYPWITISKPESYYANGQSGLGPKIFEAIHEALDVIDSDPTFDISVFNTDYNTGDAFIDAITVIHSGYGAEFGGEDCYGAAEKDRVWSHSWFMYTGAWISNDGSVRVSNYHINPGLWGICGSEISRIGVIAHETSHFLGL